MNNSDVLRSEILDLKEFLEPENGTIIPFNCGPSHSCGGGRTT